MRASGRMAIIAIGVFILVVVIFGRALARFYVDMLWYDGLGQSGVFWGALRARLLLFTLFFALFAVLSGTNLAIADKLAPTRFPPNAHPVVQRFHEAFGRRLRVYRYAVAAVFAFLLALPTTTQWQSWLLFRNRQSFGVADAQFGADIGFYVFELPFLSFVLDWLFFAMVIVLLFIVISHVLNGGVMFASPIPTISQGARGHLAVILAVLAALKAADYWIRRYETTNERRGFVQGATYSVVNALHPALLLLAFVAIVTAGLYLSTLKTQSWRFPLVASAVWVVLAIGAGYIYPAAVQGLVVNANQRSREAEYIERNVVATRAAMGLTGANVQQVAVEFGALSAEEIADDVGPLENVRLLNPEEMLARFSTDVEETQAGLRIDDLDVDRYVNEGTREQVLIAARELDLESAGNRSWQGRHLINTRGCGLVMAPASRVRSNGQPDYEDVEVDRPELYFSPALEGYAIVGTEETERSCGGAEDAPYEGGAGVQMSSFLRRAAFGLAFLDYNIVGSGAIDGDSQMLWVRNIHDRLEKLAPFLSFDGDPYPAVVERAGRVVDRRLHLDGAVPLRRSGGKRCAVDPGDRDPSRCQLRPQQRQGRRRRVRRFGDALRRGRRRRAGADHQSVDVRVPRAVHAIRRDAPGTAPARALPRGSVPRPNERVLEVPGDLRIRSAGVLRARRGVVGRPGAGREPPADHGDGDGGAVGADPRR